MNRTRVTMFVLAALITIGCGSAWAQPFPAKGLDTTPSMGLFQVVVDPKFWPYFDTRFPGANPFWDHAGNLTSPVLYDPTTMIQRSNPFPEGDPLDNGAPCGNGGPVPPDVIISDADMTLMPAGIEPLTPEVHTNVWKMDLQPLRDCGQTSTHCQPLPIRVRAGLGNGASFSKCPGEVGSYGGPGFPAMSFFDIFVDVTIGVGPDLEFYNSAPDEPLLVVNTNLLGFPPTVIYIHENSQAVPVILKGPGVVDGISYADGELFGYLTLSGHGPNRPCTGGTSPNPCEDFYTQVITTATPMPLPPPPGTPTGCGTFKIDLAEAPEGGGEQVSVNLPQRVQKGFIVLVETATGNRKDPANWSDIVVITKPVTGAQQQAILVSDQPSTPGAPEHGMTDQDLAPLGLHIRDVLGGNTVYVPEVGPPTVYTATNAANCSQITFNIFSDVGQETGVDSNTHGEAFGIRGIIPNPLNRSTRVDFAITRAGAAKLEIYDVTGQRVRTLNNGVLAAGKHSVVWDGRGDSGRLVAPGTYYAKLFWAGKSASEKIVLVK